MFITYVYWKNRIKLPANLSRYFVFYIFTVHTENNAFIKCEANDSSFKRMLSSAGTGKFLNSQKCIHRIMTLLLCSVLRNKLMKRH